MTSRIDLAMTILEADEGYEPEPYYCSEHYPTIGHGFRIEGTKQHDPLPSGMYISYEESINKLRGMCLAYDTKLSTNPDTKTAYENGNDVQKAVFISIVHQTGLYGLLKFKKFLSASRAKNWGGAAYELRNSLAARRTPKRWVRNASMMETGQLHGYYR